MKPTCVIKSHPKGISLIMDDQCEFETLAMDVCELFANSKDFFGEGELILSVEGRNLSPEETLVIIEAIELNSSIRIPLILEESEIRDVRTIGATDRYFFEKINKNAKIIRGNVGPGQTIRSDTGILILGDVKKNAKIVAKGSVCVVGKLEGEVIAGESGEPNCCIVAGKFLAKQATICGVKKDINVKYRGFRKRGQQEEPVVVKLLRGYLHAEPLSSGLVTQDE